MALSSHYDALIIGSGQGGTPLASAFAKAGRKTALVESKHIGGCCINEGCTPTKALVASGRNAYMTRRGADFGVHTPGGKDGKIALDMLKVRQRKRDIVDSFRSGGESRTQAAGVEVLMGVAAFVDKKTMRVKLNVGEEKTITAEKIFINTGERPAKPRVENLESVASERVLDYISIQELGEVPEHLLILGGGYIGLEFGQLFRRFGAQVTIVQRSTQLLPREDPDIAECMLKILQEDGVKVLLNTSATRIDPLSSGDVEITIHTKGGNEQKLLGSHFLSAAGRTPNIDMLNLGAAGISTVKSGHIAVNSLLETSTPNIYALGDVKGPPAFTHISYDGFRVLQHNLLTSSSSSGATSSPAKPLTTENRIVPYVVYTDPQLGHVGLHEHEARIQFPQRSIKVAKMPMEYVARALECEETRGMMKAVVDGESGEILGFTCLGLEGGEIMAVVQMAMMGKVPWQKLRDAVWAHPSLAESLNNIWGFLE